MSQSSTSVRLCRDFKRFDITERAMFNHVVQRAMLVDQSQDFGLFSEIFSCPVTGNHIHKGVQRREFVHEFIEFRQNVNAFHEKYDVFLILRVWGIITKKFAVALFPGQQPVHRAEVLRSRRWQTVMLPCSI